MAPEGVLDDVIEVAAGVLEVPAATLSPTTDLATLEAWDSFRQLNLMLALEEYFGIELAPDDMEQLHHVDTIAKLVAQRRA